MYTKIMFNKLKKKYKIKNLHSSIYCYFSFFFFYDPSIRVKHERPAVERVRRAPYAPAPVFLDRIFFFFCTRRFIVAFERLISRRRESGGRPDRQQCFNTRCLSLSASAGGKRYRNWKTKKKWRFRTHDGVGNVKLVYDIRKISKLACRL